MASNLSMQPKDAAEINDMFFRASASERALDPAQSRRHPVAGFGANSRRTRGARHRNARNGRVRRRHRKLHAGTRRDPDIAVARRRPGGQRSRRRAAGLRGQGAGHAERGFSAGVAVSQSRIRHFGEQRLPAVAPVRPLERAIRPDHAGGMARLDHGGHPRQISPLALRRRTPSRPRRARPDPPGGAIAGRRHRRTRARARTRRSGN